LIIAKQNKKNGLPIVHRLLDIDHRKTEQEKWPRARSWNRPVNFNARPLFISLTISGLILLCGVILIPDLNIRQILARLLWPLTRLMLFITIGLIIGQIIEASGWTKTLAALARPLFRFGRLGDHCGAAFTAAFFSGVTANAMLLDFFKDGYNHAQAVVFVKFYQSTAGFFSSSADDIFYRHSTYRLGRWNLFFNYFCGGYPAYRAVSGLRSFWTFTGCH
jgi:hypothetical protein